MQSLSLIDNAIKEIPTEILTSKIEIFNLSGNLITNFTADDVDRMRFKAKGLHTIVLKRNKLTSVDFTDMEILKARCIF